MATIEAITQTPGNARALPAAGQSTAPALRMRLTGWRLSLVDAVRRQPGLSLALALGAGLAVGRGVRIALNRWGWTRARPRRRLKA